MCEERRGDVGQVGNAHAGTIQVNTTRVKMGECRCGARMPLELSRSECGSECTVMLMLLIRCAQYRIVDCEVLAVYCPGRA